MQLILIFHFPPPPKVMDDHDGSPSVSESVPFPRERMELWRRMHRVKEDILTDFKGEDEERRDEL